MEKNLWDALHCQATLTELAVLALYAQSVSHPYMYTILGEQNSMLDMGPFHHKVHAHIKSIIRNPALLIGPNASYEKGAVDGLCWKSPDVIKAVQNMKQELPHLHSLLVRFFEGAAKVWKCFTLEFAPGGLIDEATTEGKDLAWLPTTNDVNEGALGSFCVLMRRQPQLTVLQYNAQAMFHHNETQAFMEAKFTTPEDFKFLHQEARNLTGVDKKRKLEIINYAEEKVAKKQEAAKVQQEKTAKQAAKIASIRLIFYRDSVVASTGERLKDQFNAFKAAGAPNIPNRSRVGVLRQALEEAIDFYHADKWDPYKNPEEVLEEEGETPDTMGIEGDEEDEWEDL